MSRCISHLNREWIAAHSAEFARAADLAPDWAAAIDHDPLSNLESIRAVMDFAPTDYMRGLLYGRYQMLKEIQFLTGAGGQMQR